MIHKGSADVAASDVESLNDEEGKDNEGGKRLKWGHPMFVNN